MVRKVGPKHKCPGALQPNAMTSAIVYIGTQGSWPGAGGGLGTKQ